MIDPAALRSLLAVRDSGSVAAAAALLDFTPSAVSQQLARLARDSGAPVVERVGRGVVVTGHGRLLATRGEALLADLEALSRLAAGEEATGSFTIAAFSTAVRGLLAPALSRLRSTAPGLVVEVEELDPPQALARLDRGGADLAIVHDWERIPLAVPDAIDATLLLTDVADVLVAADHPLAAAATVAPERLVGETWISTRAGTICHEWLLRMFADVGARPRIAFQDSEFTNHVRFVEEGLAVALVPRLGRGVLPAGVVALRTVDPASARRVSAARRRASGPSAARDAVLEALRLAAASV